MLKKVYVLFSEHYDYFGGHKHYTEIFSSAAEALAARREDLTHEFNYDDAWYEVGNIRTRWVWEKDPHNYHGERCGYKEAQRRRERREREELAKKYNIDVETMELLEDLLFTGIIEDEELPF